MGRAAVAPPPMPDRPKDTSAPKLAKRSAAAPSPDDLSSDVAEEAAVASPVLAQAAPPVAEVPAAEEAIQFPKAPPVKGITIPSRGTISGEGDLKDSHTSSVDMDEVLKQIKEDSIGTRVVQISQAYSLLSTHWIKEHKGMVIAIFLVVVVVVGGINAFNTFYPRYLEEKALTAYENDLYQEAIDAVEDYRKYDTDNFGLVYLLARAKLKQGDFSGALDEFNLLSSFSDVPNQADVDFYFYQGLIGHESVEDALRNLARALEADSNHLPSRLLRRIYGAMASSSLSSEIVDQYLGEVKQIDRLDGEKYVEQLNVMLVYLLEHSERIFGTIRPISARPLQVRDISGVGVGFKNEYTVDMSGIVEKDVYDPAHIVDVLKFLAIQMGGNYEDSELGYLAGIFADQYTKRADYHLGGFLAGVYAASQLDYSDAYKFFDQVSQAYSGDPSVLLNKATARLFSTPDAFILSFDDYNNVLTVETENVLGLNNRGFINLWFTDNLNKAKQDLARAMKVAPDDISVIYNLAQTHHVAGENSDAVPLFDKVVEQNPVYGNVYLYRGLSYKATGQLEKAVKDFNDFKIQDPQSVEPYVQNAILFDDSAGYKLAIRELTKALTIKPNDDRIETILADFYLKADRIFDAERLLESIGDSDNPSIRLLRGRLLLSQEDPSAESVLKTVYDEYLATPERERLQNVEVFIYYLDALLLNNKVDLMVDVASAAPADLQNDIEILKRQATALNKRGNATEALGFARRALEIDSLDFGVQVVLGDIYSDTGRFQEAISTFETAQRIKPESVDVLYKLESLYDLLNSNEKLSYIKDQIARVESQQVLQAESKDVLNDIVASGSVAGENVLQNEAQVQRLRESIEQINEKLADNPGEAVLYYNRGVVELSIGDNTAAVNSMQQAVEIDPDNADYQMGLAQSYSRAGLYSDAVGTLTDVITADPNHFEAVFNRAVAYHNAKDVVNAVKDYTTAIRLNPGYANAYYNRGAILVSAGDYYRAIEEFTRVIELRNSDIKSYLARSQVYRLLGDTEKADRDLEAARILRASASGGSSQ